MARRHAGSYRRRSILAPAFVALIAVLLFTGTVGGQDCSTTGSAACLTEDPCLPICTKCPTTPSTSITTSKMMKPGTHLLRDRAGYNDGGDSGGQGNLFVQRLTDILADIQDTIQPISDSQQPIYNAPSIKRTRPHANHFRSKSMKMAQTRKRMFGRMMQKAKNNRLPNYLNGKSNQQQEQGDGYRRVSPRFRYANNKGRPIEQARVYQDEPHDEDVDNDGGHRREYARLDEDPIERRGDVEK